MKKRVLVAAVLIPVAAALAFAGVVLSDLAQGRALIFYLLSVGAVALLLLASLLGRGVPTASLRRLPAGSARRRVKPVAQLEKIKKAVAAAAWSEAQIHDSLRPIVREIVIAKLAYRHGIDFERSPVMARDVIGDGYAWELARPDRKPPRIAQTGGWSRQQIDALLDELEAL